jgi:hypothetical protein
LASFFAICDTEILRDSILLAVAPVALLSVFELQAERQANIKSTANLLSNILIFMCLNPLELMYATIKKHNHTLTGVILIL